jgi:hypothetical protein
MLTQSFIKRSVLTASVFLYSSVALAQKMPLNILPSGHLVVQAEVEGKKEILFWILAVVSIFFWATSQRSQPKGIL